MTNGLIAEFKRLVPTSPAASLENVLGRTSWRERLGENVLDPILIVRRPRKRAGRPR